MHRSARSPAQPGPSAKSNTLQPLRKQASTKATRSSGTKSPCSESATGTNRAVQGDLSRDTDGWVAISRQFQGEQTDRIAGTRTAAGRRVTTVLKRGGDEAGMRVPDDWARRLSLSHFLPPAGLRWGRRSRCSGTARRSARVRSNSVLPTRAGSPACRAWTCASRGRRLRAGHTCDVMGRCRGRHQAGPSDRAGQRLSIRQLVPGPLATCDGPDRLHHAFDAKITYFGDDKPLQAI